MASTVLVGERTHEHIKAMIVKCYNVIPVCGADTVITDGYDSKYSLCLPQRLSYFDLRRIQGDREKLSALPGSLDGKFG